MKRTQANVLFATESGHQLREGVRRVGDHSDSETVSSPLSATDAQSLQSCR
jgi:hypothetical protein